jgi:DNA-binding IclR family transcriptional regulator
MAEKKYIQSIQRASRILNIIADRGTVKLNDICEETGLKTSTAFGILQTLEYEGQVSRTNNGLDYTLGLNSLKLGLSYLNSSGISNKIHVLLQKLVTIVDETVYFALQVGDRYYYLDYILSSQPLKVVPEEGQFIDLSSKTAVAQVFLPENSDSKYSVDFEYVYTGMNCVAIPYRNKGKIVGCVAFSGPSNRFTETKIKEAYECYIKVVKDMGLDMHI